MEDTKKGVVARYSAIADNLAEWGGAIAGCSLVLLSVLVTAEIIGRNLFNRSTMIADEMSGYLFVALVFFGLAYTIKHDGLVRVDVFYRRFGPVMKAIADWYGVIASLVYSLIVVYFMGIYAIYSYKHDIRSAEITQTPQYIPQLFVVLGMGLLAIYLFKFVLHRCRNIP